MVVDHVHGSIVSVVEYGMYTITRPRTVKINAIINLATLCHTNWREIYGKTYQEEHTLLKTFTAIFL